MLIVVILVALLIIVALIVAYGAFNAQTSAQALGVKYRVLNSAEAGANLALNELAEDPTYPSGQCVSGTLNAKPYTGCVELNRLQNSWAYATDPETGAQVKVPANSAYIYGESSFQGGRKVYIEAIADPSPPLTLPGGVINSQNDVNDIAPEPISQDPLHPGDANVNANGNINVTGAAASTVQGSTTAVGSNQIPGGHSNGAAVMFPSLVEVQQAAQNAQSLGKSGTQVSGSSLSSGSGGALSGNVYVNGDIQLNKGTLTFSSGSNVYVNGNVCVSGSGVLANANQGQNVFVVSGVMAVTGSGNFNAAPGANSLLLVLGSDPTSFNPCGGGPFALDLEPTGTPSQIGTVYASAGSVFLGGSTTLTGAADGANVLIGGGPSSTFKYDSVQSQTTMTTGTLTYSAYNEY